MPELKVIQGRLSKYYDHFGDYYFHSCKATATRLMGVVALKITWKGKERPRDLFYQVIHLDYSEYGYDEYLEFECIPGTKTYAEKKEDMNHSWRHFVSVMGGEVVHITPDAMLRLIESAMPLAGEDVDREYDTDENVQFRRYATVRLEMMRDALSREGITSDTCTVRQAVAAVSPDRLGTCETINYFIMRVIDHDFDAAQFLSAMDREELETCQLADPGIQTLIRSSIKRSDNKTDPPADGFSHPYRVRITTLGRDGYYHSSFVIYLNDDYRAKNAKVSQIEIGTMLKLSEYESAIQVIQKEYISVFEVPDNLLNGFDGNLIDPLRDVDPTAVPNGWLFTIYKRDNSHVNKAEYHLDDDVYGYALLTIPGQLILMSHDINNITALDNATHFSFYGPNMHVAGKYLLDKTPVFHTVCHTPGVLFEDLVEPKND